MELKSRLQFAERRFRVIGSLALAVVVCVVFLASHPAATAQGQGNGLEQRVTALETKLASLQAAVTTLQTALNNEIARAAAAEAALANASPFTVNGTEVTLSGYNLHIINGLGETRTANGLGNLIVGYDAPRTPQLVYDLGPDARMGSHNIIVGDYHNYSSFGGLVSGQANEISGQHSSISGGFGNVATGNFSSVTGGVHNTAGAVDSVVSGGIGNRASGGTSVVSGGNGNTASGDYAVVSGGEGNEAGQFGSVVSGGYKVSVLLSLFGWAAGGFDPSGGIGTYHAP